jgi:hypothetical protein
LEDKNAELAHQLSEARELSSTQRGEIQELKSQLFSLQQMTPYPQRPLHDSLSRDVREERKKEEGQKAQVQKTMQLRAAKVGLDTDGDGVATTDDGDEEYPPDHDSEGEPSPQREQSQGKEDERELLREIHELREINLLYEKENERMVSIILDKDNEIKAIKSEFFDKRDSWIKEINRLSNQQYTNTYPPISHQNTTLPQQTSLPTNTSSQQTSYHQFQTKLETESEVFYLRERIDELEKQCAQQENQLTLSAQRLNSLEREILILTKNLENMKRQLLQSATS